jgi:uncharacterized glyoxalase superfamily protein PhnB
MAIRSGSSLIPTLRYRDAPKAIEFLCNAFGFEKHAVYSGEGNTVAHAQLVLGRDMIMLGSATNEGDYANWVRPPETRTSPTTQGVYIVVDDCDVHCDRARKCGALILREPVDEDYGGRGYTCRDLEGNVWSFGTYDPWAASGG